MPAAFATLIPAPNARLLPPGTTALAASWRARGRSCFPLHRRGVDFGHAVQLRRELPPLPAAERRWRAAEAVHLPGILGDGPHRCAAAIRSCLSMFDRLRDGGDFLDELSARLHDDGALRYAGSTVDRG